HQVIASRENKSVSTTAVLPAEGIAAQLPELPLPTVSFEPEPTPSPAPAPKPARGLAGYELARSLEHQGRYAEALPIYESIAETPGIARPPPPITASSSTTRVTPTTRSTSRPGASSNWETSPPRARTSRNTWSGFPTEHTPQTSKKYFEGEERVGHSSRHKG